MQIMLKDIKRLTAEDIQDFLAGSRELDFSVRSEEAYTFIEQVLNNQHYGKQSRKGKGAIRRFLIKMTSLSRAQITRLIERWGECRQVRRKPAFRPDFPRLYQAGDIAFGGPRFDRARGLCKLPFSGVSLTPEGFVSACIMDFSGSLIVGNFAKQSLKEIWEGEVYRAFRREHLGGTLTNRVCHSCIHNQPSEGIPLMPELSRLVRAKKV